MSAGRVLLLPVAVGVVALACGPVSAAAPARQPPAAHAPAPDAGQGLRGRYAVVDVLPVEVRTDGTLILRVAIRPDADIHLYAPGQAGYLAPTLTFPGEPGIETVRVDLPAGETFVSSVTGGRTRGYRAAFTLVQHVRRRAPEPGTARGIVARLRYQACSDRVCFKPETMRVEFRAFQSSRP